MSNSLIRRGLFGAPSKLPIRNTLPTLGRGDTALSPAARARRKKILAAQKAKERKATQRAAKLAKAKEARAIKAARVRERKAAQREVRKVKAQERKSIKAAKAREKRAAKAAMSQQRRRSTRSAPHRKRQKQSFFGWLFG